MSPARPPLTSRPAFVLTVSDSCFEGTRADESGDRLEARLAALGFRVDRSVVPDAVPAIAEAIIRAAPVNRLVVTTGGTGLTPRDVTPQATATVIDYEIPGIAEAMRAEGRTHTPLAALSRGLVGVRGGTLVINVPGSPKGALENLEAVVPVLEHALETLAGPFDHAAAVAAGRRDLPAGTLEDA